MAHEISIEWYSINFPKIALLSIVLTSWLLPLHYGFDVMRDINQRADGAASTEWSAYPQALYANQSKSDVSVSNDLFFCAGSTNRPDRALDSHGP